MPWPIVGAGGAYRNKQRLASFVPPEEVPEVVEKLWTFWREPAGEPAGAPWGAADLQHRPGQGEAYLRPPLAPRLRITMNGQGQSTDNQFIEWLWRSQVRGVIPEETGRRPARVPRISSSGWTTTTTGAPLGAGRNHAIGRIFRGIERSSTEGGCVSGKVQRRLDLSRNG